MGREMTAMRFMSRPSLLTLCNDASREGERDLRVIPKVLKRERESEPL